MKAPTAPPRRLRMLRRALSLSALLLGAGLVLAGLPRCSGQHALLLTVTSSSLVHTLDLMVKDLTTGAVLRRKGERVDAANPNRDISKPGQGLKLAIEFESPGNYLVYLQGEGPYGKQFFLRDYQVDGVREEPAHLVPLADDHDQDGFPACGSSQVPCGPMSCRFLDCNDDNASIHPMATEVCGDKVDNDCSAGCDARPEDGDEPCVDEDGDGEPSQTDCDDRDPCRSSRIKETSSTCNQDLASFKLPAACKKDFKPPFCGDGIDQDCDGVDPKCVIDDDCDGFSPPQDCNDKDPAINPSAQEDCGPQGLGDGKDNNCNGIVDEGCVPCDVDGDGHALPGTTDPKCTAVLDEVDDYDAGIHPATTSKTGGAEGGNVLGALRGWCSAVAGAEKNGKAPRDVDHDNDGKPAAEDGCPPISCDQDGDGFQGKQCNPPASQEDCDDTDPQTFPGAPEKCGDGKAQDCLADSSCSCDQDKDGYCPPADCNDANPEVHPWAVEKCNGIDDDCDELIDEANPDPSGVPMSVGSKVCNNDNDGQCGDCRYGDASTECKDGHLLSGICVCSPSVPDGKRDPNPSNRVACIGENLAAKASPRCFGARRAADKEHCKPGDFDCSGQDVQPTDDFFEKGQSCGSAVGECRLGVVVGCDLSKPMANLQLIKARDPNFLDGFQCGNRPGLAGEPPPPAMVLPIPELCNGRDDDCDNVVPATEKDVDGDLYLGCTGPGNCGVTAPLLGCNDCNDSVKEIFPGALERCNGLDDNCNGTKDETPNECASPEQCCPVVNACKNTQTDFFHCGACNSPCSNTSDGCVAGSCSCGSSTPCGPGQNCEAGQCGCKLNGNCKGCCDGTACRPGNAVAQCGINGAACKSCDDGNECTVDTCNATTGVCVHTNLAAGTACAGGAGKCRGNPSTCCLGCWDGSTCQLGTSNAQCGTTGVPCATCGTTSSCKIASCATGSCVITNKADQVACPGGLCWNGGCCTTCWNPAGSGSCVTSTSISYCGSEGELCATCSSTDPCLAPACTAGDCTTSNLGPTTPCGNVSDPGRCLAGVCCTNCIAGTSCVAGTTNTQCGDDGLACADCTSSGRTCVNKACTCTGCVTAGTCYAGTSNTACGSAGATCTNCTSSGSTCVNQACSCAGCMYNNTCYVNDPLHCGSTTGGPCTSNPCPTEVCKTATCTGGACGLQNVANNTNCTVGGTAGKCLNGSCCLTCISGNACAAASNDDTCGIGGVACTKCTGSTHCNAAGQCQ